MESTLTIDGVDSPSSFLPMPDGRVLLVDRGRIHVLEGLKPPKKKKKRALAGGASASSGSSSRGAGRVAPGPALKRVRSGAGASSAAAAASSSSLSSDSEGYEAGPSASDEDVRLHMLFPGLGRLKF